MLQQEYVVIDPEFHRLAEVDVLVGNPAKARARLGWSCTVRLDALVWEMVEADCRAAGVELSREQAAAG